MKFNTAVIQQRTCDINSSGNALESSLHLIDLAVIEKPDLVVLPECIYPAYFLGLHGLGTSSIEKALSGLEKAISAFCSKARQHKIYLIVGAPEITVDCLYNSAYLIDPDGKVVGTARKSFLWHFDDKWFSPGTDYPVFETALGKIGIIICNDGRQPEISRTLALKGAQVIVDVTNWVTSGSNPSKLSNPQYEYILPSRAVENRVWYIAANKVGIEAESIVCCGKSCIISPTGYELAVASSDQEEIITAEIDLSLSDNKQLNPEFDVFKGRKPQLYSLLEDSHELPVTKFLQEKVVPSELSVFASSVQLQDDLDFAGFVNKLEKIVPMMASQYSKLLVFPELPCLYGDEAAESLPSMAVALAKKHGVALVLSTAQQREFKKVKVGFLTLPTGEQYFTDKCHLDTSELQHFTCGTKQTVFETPFGRLGIMMGYEGLIPEVARGLMLQGTDMICWMTNFSSDYHRLFARTRAAENKVFLVTSNVWGYSGCGLSLIVNPGGNIIASAFPEGDQIISSQLELVLSRNKSVVPGTDLVKHRQPEVYGKVTEV